MTLLNLCLRRKNKKKNGKKYGVVGDVGKSEGDMSVLC